MKSSVAEETIQITVSNLAVNVVRKAIKNLHLGVYPPDGRVRVAAPLAVSDDAVRLAVIGKLGWIKRQRAKFHAQARDSAREMVDGESHYVQGRRYRLRVVPHGRSAKVELAGRRLVLYIRPEADTAQRERALQHWYREQLKAQIPPLLEKWQPVLGVEAAYWGVRKMKTKWGTCNAATGRLWFNLELAKKPNSCLEYLVVHELAHLRVRDHSDAFVSLLDQAIPQWRLRREELNRVPLGHEEWNY